MANKNRDKGHRWEREVVRRLKLAGLVHAVTSRSESKRTDDAGIDVCYSGPLAIQAKAMDSQQPNMRQLLDRVEEACDTLPNFKGCYPAVFHKKSRQAATVTMDADDFMEIVALLVREGLWKS